MPVASAACTGNHERDWFGTGDRFYPLQSRTDSGVFCCSLQVTCNMYMQRPIANCTDQISQTGALRNPSCHAHGKEAHVGPCP